MNNAVHPAAKALAEFNTLRRAAFHLLADASKIEGLPPVLATQALSASRLAFLNFAEVAGHRPDRYLDDAENLKFLAQSIVDPLVKEVGLRASKRRRYSDFDTKVFEDQLWTAIDGNALYELECAARGRPHTAEDDELASGSYARSVASMSAPRSAS